MKSLFVILLLSVTTYWVLGANSDSSATLIVQLNGFESDSGLALIALSNTQSNFDSRDEPLRSARIKIEQKQATCRFEYLPGGEYALKVFHDDNNDGKLNTNFLGMPTEAYGFSNNARGTFGPASWEDARFLLERDTLIIKIQVK